MTPQHWRRLARRVPTRWNSDFACLKSHVQLRKPVEQLTGDRTLNLSAYRLTTPQWTLVGQLMEVLPIFDAPTQLFSKVETPLIADVVPMLQELETSLMRVRDAPDVNSIVRVAAHAGILLVWKYHSLTDECEVYRIATVMSPNRKLQWFRDQGWSTEAIEEVQQLVVHRWEENYKPQRGIQSMSTSVVPIPPPVSRFMTPRSLSVARDPDSIHTYLSDPLVSDEDISLAGGVMQYWSKAEAARPCLSTMASDFCSAPASSVDTERAFSDGRRAVNFMQHNMSSQTFIAEMAVGSWDGTPLFSNVSRAIEVMEKKMRGRAGIQREETLRSVSDNSTGIGSNVFTSSFTST